MHGGVGDAENGIHSGDFTTVHPCHAGDRWSRHEALQCRWTCGNAQVRSIVTVLRLTKRQSERWSNGVSSLSFNDFLGIGPLFRLAS